MSENETRKQQVPAIFLDRDGVLIRYKRLLSDKNDVEIISDVPQSLSRLKDAGYLLVMISNQTVVARGIISENELETLHEVMRQKLLELGAVLDGMYYCPHHPQATIANYRIECQCRKPGTLLLEKAKRELGIDMSKSLIIGDESRDVQTGYNAGIRTVLIQNELNAHSFEKFAAEPTVVVESLTEAVDFILAKQ